MREIALFVQRNRLFVLCEELAGAAAALVCALPLISALLDTVEGIV